jgi:Tol biopolymer transport system component
LRRPARFAWRTSLFTALAVTGLATLLALWWRDRHAPASPLLAIADVRRVTFATGLEVNPRLNAGGDWLVYTGAATLGAKPQLFLQSSYGTQARALAPGDHAERPAWSPEGRRVAYVWQEGHQCEIRIVNIDDGSRQTALRCAADSLIYLDWNPTDAGILAYTAVEPGQMGGVRVQLLSDDGGWRPKALAYERTTDNLDLYPRFSPDGRMIAFRRGANPNSDIYLMSVTGGRITRLTEVRARINGFDWLPDGSGLVLDSDHEGRQELYSVLLSDRVLRSTGLVDATAPDVAARDWHVTYQMENWQSSLAELPLRDGARPRLLAPSSGRDRAAALSPNGRRIVFVSDRDGSTQLWSLDIASGHTERLTRHENASLDLPVISPDGQRVLYIVRSRGRHELWEYRFDDESRQRLEENPASLRNAVYAADGQSIWYVAWQGTRWALFGCERRPGVIACVGKETPLSAWRVERTRMDGADVLLLASPHRPRRELEIVAEAGLRSLKKLRMPASDAWTVVDDTIWYLRGAGTDSADIPSLRAFSLTDGTDRTLATFPGLRPLGYTPFLVTPDRAHVILPTITENSTDIAFARIAKTAGR